MNKKKIQVAALFNILTMLATFFIAPMKTQAATVGWTEGPSYVSTWLVKSLGGLHWTDEHIYMIKADNEPAFCVDHGTILSGGTDFSPSELTGNERERLSLIAYYGYQIDPNDVNYGITQNIIWQEYGDELLSTQLPDYDKKKAEILSKVDRHSVKPSFHNQTIELNVGESITLTDSANVLDSYKHLLANSANLQVEQNGNQLILTATKDSKESGTIQYGIASSEHIGQSFVYTKANEQTVATFRLSNAGEMNVNVKVNLNGNIQIKKVDEDTGKPVPNTKMKLEYDDQSKEVTTDKDGLATVSDLKAGTKVKISEIQANDGYVNRNEVKEVTVEPNKTIEVVFGNKAQQGVLKLKKTGQKAVSVNEQETEYGLLSQIIFDYVPLADVTFDIRSVEEIKVGDHVHAKAGSVVATVKTDDQGTLIDMPKLYLGKYEAIEKNAPNGFIMNDEPLPFEFAYGGQEIELVSQSVEAKNDFQKLTVGIHKDEEFIQDWQDNLPIIEQVPANEKTFGLFTNQEFGLTDGTVLAKDALLGYGDVQEGELLFEKLHLPEGKYYVQELVSGDSHQLDLEKYELEFKASDHETEKTINVYGESEVDEENSPILNHLHFNRFLLKKVNEEAELIEKEGYEFSYTGNGYGAIFTLEDETQNIFQTVEVNEESLALFENIPVGTFYLREKQAASDQYVLSSEVYTVVSTKKGVEIYSSEDKLLGSTIPEVTDDFDQEGDESEVAEAESDTEDIEGLSLEIESEEEDALSEDESTEKLEEVITFEVENNLVKGNAELTKKDISSGKVLPDTGIRIYDEDQKIVVEGRTDEQGNFSFQKLPAGKYSFQEFDAPDGYQLDETPIPFEIKENGETVNLLVSILGGLLVLGVVVFIYLKKRQNK